MHSLALLIGLLPATLSAADGTWTGGAAATWNTTASNWSGVSGTAWDAANGPSNRAIFNTSAATASVSGVVFTNGITFSNTATLSGGTITLSGPAVTAAANAVISSTLAGSVGLTKSGAAVLTLSGSNTYSGDTTVAAGTLVLSNNNAAGTGRIIFFGQTLRLDGTGGNILLTNSLSNNGGTLVNAAGNNKITAGLSINSGASNSYLRVDAGTLECAGNYGFGTTGRNLYLQGLGSGLYSGNLAFNNNNLFKQDAGTWTLAGNNTYSGATNLQAGTLIARSASALGSTSAVSVSANANLSYIAASDTALNLGSTLAITGGTSTTIGASIGSTATSAQINVTGNATTTAAAVKVNVYGISGVSALAGTNTYTLIRGGGASSTLNNATYVLGAVYNNTNFTVGALSKSTTDLQVGITSQPALTTAFWKGGFSGATHVWAASNGASTSNWTVTSGGAVQALVPGASTAVTLSSSAVTTAPTATVLGADMTINSLTLADTTNGLGLNSDGYTLTIIPSVSTSGITMNSSVPASSIAANLELDAAQTWTNHSVNGLTVSGAISGAGSLTKAGVGPLTLSGINTFTGGTTLSSGVLLLGNASALGTSSGLTINGGSLNLNGYNPKVGLLSGGSGGVITTSSAASSTLTTNSADNSTYAGTIQNGSGTLALNKQGAGALTLSGSNSYSGGTTVSGGTLVLAKGNAAGTGNINLDDGSTLRLDNSGAGPNILLANSLVNNGGTLQAKGTSTVSGNVTLVGATSYVKVEGSNSVMEISGAVSGKSSINLLGTSTPVTSGTTTYAQLAAGTLAFSGANTYEGDTIVSHGTFDLRAAGSLKFVPTANGVCNRITGQGTAILNGTFHLDLSQAEAAPGNSWTLVNVATHSGSLAGITTTPALSFTNSSGVWSATGSSGIWKYVEATGVLSLTAPASGFSLWIADPAFGTLSSISPDGDPDRDGISNLLEYALNGNPGTANAAILPVQTTTSTAFVFTYQRRTDSLIDTTQIFRYGSNATGWTNVLVPATSGTVGAAVITVTPGSPADTITISIPKSVAPGGSLSGHLVVSQKDTSPAPTGMVIHVSPTGNDATGDGSGNAPFKTVAAARDAIRSSGANANMQDDIIVYLHGGRYELTNPLLFTEADSGSNGHFIIYRSYPGETAAVTGGKRVSGWTQVPGKSWWSAPVPLSAGFADYFRQLYVNGIRAERARSGFITGVAYFNDPATPQNIDGITFPAAALKNYTNVTDLRLAHVSSFKVDEFPIMAIRDDATIGLKQIQLQQPYCQTRYDRGGGLFEATDQWMIVNSIQELDEPGEWYLDRVTRQLYYWPTPGDDMTAATVDAPVVDTLIRLTGSSSTAKVRNIRFQGLVIEHGNWLFPGDYYIGGGQAEMIYGAPSGGNIGLWEMPGQIVLDYTREIQFLGNTIRHLGSCGIQPHDGASDTLIQGNVFYDITGAAVLGGRLAAGLADPKPEMPANTLVTNNVIRNIGRDFMGAALIDNLRHQGFRVTHNDMADAPYMGFHQRNDLSLADAIATGIGVTEVSSNKIAMANAGGRHGVGDGGYIYTYGIWPDSIVSGNDMDTINISSGNVSGFYLDNSSYGIHIAGNVMRGVKAGSMGYKFVRSLNDDPTVNSADGNWGDSTVNWFQVVTDPNYHQLTQGQPLPAAPQAIVDAAGLEPAYSGLASRIYRTADLARGKTATASSQWDSNSTPSRAVDWNFGSKWHTASGDNAGWWSVDLGAAYVIQRIEISARTDLDQAEARRNFQVQGSNQSNFATFTVLAAQDAVPFAFRAVGLSNSWLKDIGNPNGFRYLRVIKTAPGLLNFSEFQVHGYPATENTAALSWDSSATGQRTDGPGNWFAPGQWWTSASNQEWTDSVDVTIGNGRSTAGTIQLSAAADVRNLYFQPTGSGDYTLIGGQITLSGTAPAIFAGVGCQPLIASTIRGSVGLTKSGSGNLVLSGSNTFTGNVGISAGTLTITQNSALGAGSKAINLTNGGTLALDNSATGTNIVLGGSYTFSSSFAGATIRNLAGNNSVASPLYISFNATNAYLRSDAGSLTLLGNIGMNNYANARVLYLQGGGNGTLSGNISDTSTTGNLSIIKQDAGTWTFSGANSHRGGTSVNGGTLAVSGTLTASAVTVSNTGSTLSVTGAGSLGASLAVNAGARLAIAVANTPASQPARSVSGNVTLNSASVLDLTAAGTPTVGVYTLLGAGSLTTLPTTINTPVPTPGTTWTVSNPGNNSLVLTVAVSAGFNTWINAGWPTLSDKTAAGDPDYDSISNLMEYVLYQGDPSVSSTTILPSVAMSGVDVVFTFYRRNDSTTDTTQTFQFGSGLDDWTDLVIPGGAGVAVIANNPIGGIDKVQVTMNQSGSPRLFGRFKVVLR